MGWSVKILSASCCWERPGLGETEARLLLRSGVLYGHAGDIKSLPSLSAWLNVNLRGFIVPSSPHPLLSTPLVSSSAGMHRVTQAL